MFEFSSSVPASPQSSAQRGEGEEDARENDKTHRPTRAAGTAVFLVRFSRRAFARNGEL
jgi:hypothetical protein